MEGENLFETILAQTYQRDGIVKMPYDELDGDPRVIFACNDLQHFEQMFDMDFNCYNPVRPLLTFHMDNRGLDGNSFVVELTCSFNGSIALVYGAVMNKEEIVRSLKSAKSHRVLIMNSVGEEIVF